MSAPTRAIPAEPAAVPTSAAGLVNVANALTVLRMLMVPVLLICLLAERGSEWRVAAFGVFAVAALTDQVDGILARGLHLVTDFGKIADPIADKALIGAALLALSSLGKLPWWVTGLVLARELGITALRFVVIRHTVIAASRGGKLKTFAQTLAIGLYVLPLHGAWASARGWLLAFAVVLTVLTGLDYLLRAAAARRSGRWGTR
ncbi:MAG: CDP-diacylglycerol--glycerol-3-phosphate 3-phosphatidyltransferase [Mycobacteriales bacterium]